MLDGEISSKGVASGTLGPMLEDVIKEVEFKGLQGPAIVPKRELIDVADEQTASIRRIADLLGRGVEQGGYNSTLLRYAIEGCVVELRSIRRRLNLLAALALVLSGCSVIYIWSQVWGA